MPVAPPATLWQPECLQTWPDVTGATQPPRVRSTGPEEEGREVRCSLGAAYSPFREENISREPQKLPQVSVDQGGYMLTLYCKRPWGDSLGLSAFLGGGFAIGEGGGR